MNKEQLAAIYAARLTRCLTAIKIFIVFTIAAIAALGIFAVVSKAIGLYEANPDAVLLGIIITGFTAVAGVFCTLATFVAAQIFLKKLKGLGKAEDEA